MVKDSDYAYAVARIRANERYMLTASDIEVLISSESVEKAVSFLSSKKWFDSSCGSSINKICENAQRNLWTLISESVPDKSELEIFTVKNDFFNIKSVLKDSASSGAFFDHFIYPTTIDTEKLREAASQHKYDKLHNEYYEAVREAAEALNKTEDGQIAEVILDRAALSFMLEKAQKSRCQLVREITEFFVALSNIKIAVKCISSKKGSAFAEKSIVKCNSLDTDKLIKLCDEDMEMLISYIGKTEYKKAAELLAQGTVRLEKWIDDTIVELAKKSKYEFFGFAPICGYYYGKLSEIKTVKAVLSCKENGFSEDLIRERVRALYV